MLGFIIALAAGAATPKIEDFAARPLARALGQKIEVFDDELPVISFMIAMLGAAILSAIFSNGSAVGVILGGILGVFAVRLVRFAQQLIEGSASSD